MNNESANTRRNPYRNKLTVFNTVNILYFETGSNREEDFTF